MNIQKAKEVLRANGYIMHFWCKDDILYRAKDQDIELNLWQIDQIASLMEHKTDANIGINWEVIDVWIDHILNWTTTDPAFNQKGRQIDAHTYQFEEERLSNPETGEKYLYEAEIDLNDYTEDEIKSAMDTFGYEERQSDWIVAECLFELSED